nr:MAG TPA: hypothetical protein [Caudoviricetes sp.]
MLLFSKIRQVLRHCRFPVHPLILRRGFPLRNVTIPRNSRNSQDNFSRILKKCRVYRKNSIS